MQDIANYSPSRDDLKDFEKRQISLLNIEKTVYVSGAGPAVIVLPEMPGISPEVARFARWVRDAGMTVYIPSLFGKDGAVPSADEGAIVFRKACVSAEFNALSAGKSSPVTSWLRALAKMAHGECGGPGVGAIGMCMTGNFALSMMLEPSMLAPVIAQPSLPLNDPSGLELDAQELELIKSRMQQQNLKALAYRFADDPYCREQRFHAYRCALGDRFVPKVLPSECGNKVTSPFFSTHIPSPHSVFTAHLVDQEGHPTIHARDEVLKFFQQQLMGGAQRSRRKSCG